MVFFSAKTVHPRFLDLEDVFRRPSSPRSWTSSFEIKDPPIGGVFGRAEAVQSWVSWPTVKVVTRQNNRGCQAVGSLSLARAARRGLQTAKSLLRTTMAILPLGERAKCGGHVWMETEAG